MLNYNTDRYLNLSNTIARKIYIRNIQGIRKIVDISGQLELLYSTLKITSIKYV